MNLSKHLQKFDGKSFKAHSLQESNKNTYMKISQSFGNSSVSSRKIAGDSNPDSFPAILVPFVLHVYLSKDAKI